MKWTIGAIAAASMILAACAQQPPRPQIDYSSYITKAADPWTASQPTNDGWQPSEMIVNKEGDSFWKSRGVTVLRSREGTAPSGLSYRYYSDGTGSVGDITNGEHWTINCAIDRISDKRTCHISSSEANIFVQYRSNKHPTSICVWDHDFPGRTAMIRADKNTAIKTNEEGCVAAPKILKQMLAGSAITTRSIKWPYEDSIDKTASLKGFGDAVKLVAFIRTNIEKLSFRAASAPQ